MTFTNHAQNDFDLSNTLTLLRYFTHAYPPKAKVRGSNPLGCAKYPNNVNGLDFYKNPENPVFVDFWYVQILYKN